MMILADWLRGVGNFLLGFAPNQPMWALSFISMKMSDALYYVNTKPGYEYELNPVWDQ